MFSQQDKPKQPSRHNPETDTQKHVRAKTYKANRSRNDFICPRACAVRFPTKQKSQASSLPPSASSPCALRKSQGIAPQLVLASKLLGLLQLQERTILHDSCAGGTAANFSGASRREPNWNRSTGNSTRKTVAEKKKKNARTFASYIKPMHTFGHLSLQKLSYLSHSSEMCF